MSRDIAELLVGALGAYLTIGFVVAILFVVAGIGRFDPAAKGSGIGFRLIVLPGLIGLWPLAIVWWIGALFRRRAS